jgi:genome maintenance exonuclease 1
MKKQFVHVDVIDDLEVPKRQTKDGKRVYLTPEGNHYPSITTILGSQPKPGLVEWRERVGDEEADKIMREASTLGTTVHLLCENYLNNNELKSNNDEAISVFNRLRFILSNIDNIVGLEIPLYSDYLRVAGTTDCIADYNGKLSVIDFKTSRKPKKPEWIEDYYIQAFFYSSAFFEMTGCIPEQIVILIAVRDSFEVQVFKKPMSEIDIYIDKLIQIMKREPNVVQIG